jgi:hypothetical protein
MGRATRGPHRGRWRLRGDRWRLRHGRWPRGKPPMGAASGQTTAEAIQLAIGLLTASLDSAELQAWAIRALPTEDPVALGDLLAGLHIVSQLLLHQLHEATGQPPAATLQKLAIAAAASRDTPSPG